MSDTKKTLAQRLVVAMRSIDAVTKRGTNDRQKYNYVKAADVANEVLRVLCDEGIAFTYGVDATDRWEKATNGGGTLFFCEVRASFRFIDQDSGETLEVKGVGWGADSLDKAPYKAMTGALKYALRMNFLIPDEEDPEKGNELYDTVVAELCAVHVPAPGSRVLVEVPRLQPKRGDAYEPDGPMFDEHGDLIEAKSTIQHRQQQEAARADESIPSTILAKEGERRITEPMAKRFIAISKANGKTWDQINAALKGIGVKEAKEIPSDQYEVFVSWAGGSNERRA
jgi:ERF superfamily